MVLKRLASETQVKILAALAPSDNSLTMSRRIPASGINLFQLIYILIREYQEKSGLSALNLSLGNPDGVPDPRVLELQSRFALNPAFELHTYAEDNNINQFAEGMVKAHTHLKVSDYSHLKALPIAGIKTATALLPLACGLHLPDKSRRESLRVVSNLPAYDVIGTWTNSYLASHRIPWPLLSRDNMRMNIPLLRQILKDNKLSKVDMIHVIRPGNPAAVGANPEEWKALIEVCLETGARLVCDGAYTGLAGPHHTPLMRIAKDYPDLEWVELFSCSKSFNDPGARLGAMVGTKDFIEDFILIKGNTDSGPVPSVMAAYGELFKNEALTQELLTKLTQVYAQRIEFVVASLKEAGFEQACQTDAGFFTLWKCPKSILGLDLEAEAKKTQTPLAEVVNRKIISETGIVGVHFTGQNPDGSADPLLRYAVCTDVLAPEFQKRFREQLGRLKPKY